MNTRGMSGAGLLVTGTLCVGLILTLATVCAMVLRGDEIPSQLETIVGGLLVGVPALLARTYQDRAEPVQVTGESGLPVVVEDAGAVDVVYVLLVVFLVLVILVVLGVL